MSKQGDISPGVGFPSDYERFLAEHAGPAVPVRKSSSWPLMIMNQWMKLFVTHELPLAIATLTAVNTGLSAPAFELTAEWLPRGSDIPGSIFNLHSHANESTGDLLMAMAMRAGGIRREPVSKETQPPRDSGGGHQAPGDAPRPTELQRTISLALPRPPCS